MSSSAVKKSRPLMQPKRVELLTVLCVAEHLKCPNFVMDMIRSLLVDCYIEINEKVESAPLSTRRDGSC